MVANVFDKQAIAVGDQLASTTYTIFKVLVSPLTASPFQYLHTRGSPFVGEENFLLPATTREYK